MLMKPPPATAVAAAAPKAAAPELFRSRRDRSRRGGSCGAGSMSIGSMSAGSSALGGAVNGSAGVTDSRFDLRCDGSGLDAGVGDGGTSRSSLLSSSSSWSNSS